MRINGNTFSRHRAFTLIEALIASAIAALMFGGIVYGYIQSSRNAEWSAYSFAAQSLAMQRLEQARSCKWDPDAVPTVDELTSTNFPIGVSPLDIPMSGSNVVYATNYTTITTISTAPPLKMISVETVWPFSLNKRLYTNTIATYRAPDA
jgi:type II secretory pathway pseudopilin PulG